MMRIWYFQVGSGEIPFWSMAKSRQVHILEVSGSTRATWAWVRGTSPSRVKNWAKKGRDVMSPLGAFNAYVPGHIVKVKDFKAWLKRKLPVKGGWLAIGVNQEYEKDYGEIRVHVMHDLRRWPKPLWRMHHHEYPETYSNRKFHPG